MRKVEHITRDDIAAFRAAELGQPEENSSKANKAENVKIQPKKFYTDKLSDAEIRDFFAPLGYISHSPIDSIGGETVEPFIMVECEDLVIMFNDFTTKVFEKKQNSNAANYAEMTNSNVGELIALQVATELFGKKFPESYPKKKRDFDLANINSEFRKLSPELKKFLGNAKDIQEAKVKSTFNVNEYGAANLEDVPENLKR